MRGSPWLLYQLVDGTFPSGGFAHSNGLEATMVLGGLGTTEDAVRSFLAASSRQVGRAFLPFVRSAAAEPERLAEIDAAFDATSTMSAPNRSSRAQGRALASSASRVWDELAPVAAYARSAPAHHAPIFGAVFARLGVSVEETQAAYLHASTRSLLSAAVRLGLLGPLEAQRIHADHACVLDDVLARSPIAIEDAAQTAPLLELFASLHDHLDGRMFQS